MHNFNSRQLFRAFFLLLFGLMIGDVFGGAIKITLNPNENGDPQFGDTLNSIVYIPELTSGDSFLLETDFTISLELISGVNSITMQVYEINSNGFLNIYSNQLNASQNEPGINKFEENEVSFGTSMFCSDLIEGLGLSVLVLKNGVYTTYWYYIPISSDSEFLGNNRKSNWESQPHKKITIFKGKEAICNFKIIEGLQWELKIYDLNGRMVDSYRLRNWEGEYLELANSKYKENQIYIFIWASQSLNQPIQSKKIVFNSLR